MGENDETGNGAHMSRLYEKRDELRIPKPKKAKEQKPAKRIGFLCNHPWKPGHTCPESEAT